MVFRTSVLIIISAVLLSACKDRQTTVYQWPIPEGFPAPKVPADNPMTVEKVALGRQIFYDQALSYNQQQSCASCHQQSLAFSDALKTSIGSTGQQHRRNSQALVNIAYNKTLTWAHDGITSLEQQILLPMFGEEPVELGITGHEEEVLLRFSEGKYSKLFAQAFPEQKLSYLLIVKALASYVRSLISLQAPFDKYAYQAQDDAISASAIRGMNLFFSEKLECHHCHGGFNFTQSTSHEKQIIDRRPFHNTGLYFVETVNGYPVKDSGLSEVSGQKRDNGRFRAPTLRNIEKTAPYMHDGSIATLAEVLDFYAAGGREISVGKYKGDGRLNPLKSPFIRGFFLSKQDKTDLINFMLTLTDDAFLTDENLGPPH